jgi:signal peptidase I
VSSADLLPGADQLRVQHTQARSWVPAAEPRAHEPDTAGPAPARARRPSRIGRGARTLGAVATWACLGVIAGVVVAVGAPFLFGAQPLMVRSGSMEPVIHTGDLVVVRTITAEEIEIGDVVTFRAPDNSGRLLTHRVRDLRIEGASMKVTTKGDAVTGTETWMVPRGGTIGRVEYRLWKAGYVVAWARTPAALLAAGAAAAFVVGAWVLVGIWRGD